MRALISTLAVLLTLTNCAKKAAPRACFDVTTRTTSQTTREVFTRRGCQGGGVTWAGILRVLVNREGSPQPAMESGWTGDVKAMNGGLLSIDEEGDGARFCTTLPALLDRVRGEVDRLNADPKALEKAMGETTALELECEGADDEALAQLNQPNPVPTPGDEELAYRALQQQRFEAALRGQPAWCWPTPSREGSSGMLRFEPDGGLTHREFDGGASNGRWRLATDGRVEAMLPRSLHHFDVEASGALSTHFIPAMGADGTVKVIVEELVPGDRCLRK
ncbi:MAG: hypothetical protein Q8N23_18830 [Archangium sp.]|nr:hypothetical protein [Archangium sp.]MDP3573630.1 hypothetical protein [Archangium sp.]